MLARTDKFVSFERAVHIVHGTQVIDAESALGELTENEEHCVVWNCRAARASKRPSAAPGELKWMSGDIINLTYHEKSELIAERHVIGQLVLRIAGEKGAPERVLHARRTSKSAWHRTARP